MITIGSVGKGCIRFISMIKLFSTGDCNDWTENMFEIVHDGKACDCLQAAGKIMGQERFYPVCMDNFPHW